MELVIDFQDRSGDVPVFFRIFVSMEKKGRKKLAERIADNFRKAEREEARSRVIDLRPFMSKKPGKYS